jgi:hypothetical protein
MKYPLDGESEVESPLGADDSSFDWDSSVFVFWPGRLPSGSRFRPCGGGPASPFAMDAS